MPQRIQRKRTKDWRTPLCTCGCGKPAIYVGRPTKWGNPWKVGTQVWTESETADPNTRYGREFTITPAMAVEFYRQAFALDADEARDELGGHDLSCFCPLEDGNGNRVPCHADVLLELAAREESS